MLLHAAVPGGVGITTFHDRISGQMEFDFERQGIGAHSFVCPPVENYNMYRSSNILNRTIFFFCFTTEGSSGFFYFFFYFFFF